MNKRPKNVLFIMDDQHHPLMLSALRGCPKGVDGLPLIETPNLNRLLHQGAYFKHAYTPSAVCGPSRTSFFTGMYCHSHGKYSNTVSAPIEQELADQSLVAVFQQHGYRTGFAGKCHLPNQISHYFEFQAELKTYEKEYLPAHGLSDRELHTPTADMQCESWTSSIPKEHSTEVWTAERAMEFLDGQSPDSPFFFWLTFQRPHSPHSPDPETEKLVDPDRVPLPWEDYDLFEQTRIQPRPGREAYWNCGGWQDPSAYRQAVARHYSLIGLIDEQIGRVLDRLEELGLKEDTLIVFSPDHGEFGGDFGQLGKNLPVYEQLYRVPLIWCDPTTPQDHGKVLEGLWSTIDIFPSLMERMGWEMPARGQGESFLSAIDGWRPMGREYVFFETTMCKVIRTREHKLAIHLDHPHEGQLFDMLPVPDELHNLWDDPAHAAVRERLTRQLLWHLAAHTQLRDVDPKWEPLVPTWHNRKRGWILPR